MNKNNKPFKMNDLYYEVDYHLDEKETVFNNPEKYGFVEVAMVNSNGIEMITIQEEAVEYFIVGYTGVPKKLFGYDKIDKTVIHIPNADNIVLVYNKYQEEEVIKDNMKKPLIFIQEDNIKIYSRCIVCRLDKDGAFKSISKEDFNIIKKYLADCSAE